MKKIIVFLCIFTFVCSMDMQIYAETTGGNDEFPTPYIPPYNNEEVVVRVSDIDNGKQWGDPASIYKYSRGYIYNRNNIVESIGAEPYWRLGKYPRYYAIYKVNDDVNHYLIFTLGSDSYTIVDGWYVSKIPSRYLFEKYVKKGTSLEIIKLIDADTLNLFEDTIFEDTMCKTYHRFEDGTILNINYQKDSKGKWIVDTYRYDEDDAQVVENLLDIDYQLIKNDNPNEEAEFLEKLKKLEETSTSTNIVTSSTTQVVKKKPAKVQIKTAKRTKRNKILVKFKKVKNAKKYQIQYATNKKFKKARIKITKKNSYVIKRISKKKTYYIRVRGVNGTKKGVWSKIKKVKPKK